jgi:alpha/beta superfamily hydrolase
MSAEPFSLPARDGVQLEGLLQLPPGAGPHAAAVITHSHSLQAGGHMYAHVLRAVAEALAAAGIAALRINFRGVQNSGGAFDDGGGELNDVGGAVDFLRVRPEIDPDRIALVGYSFGARVCLNYALGDGRIAALVALGLPARRFVRNPPQLALPLLLLVGDGDRQTPAHFAEQFAAQQSSATLRVLQGTDHYYRGREADVARAVVEFLQARAQPRLHPQGKG